MRRVLVSSLAMAFAFAIATSPVHGATIHTMMLTVGAESSTLSPDAGITGLMLNGNTLDVVIAIPLTAVPAATPLWTYLANLDLANPALFSAITAVSASSEWAALVTALNDAMAQVNTQTSPLAVGEISGTLASGVPEPSTLILGGSILAAIALLKRK